ncbi:hypothetical protein [Mycobacterium sp.]|nr:hypothetical protein [Mycobacterium sp.]
MAADIVARFYLGEPLALSGGSPQTGFGVVPLATEEEPPPF